MIEMFNLGESESCSFDAYSDMFHNDVKQYNLRHVKSAKNSQRQTADLQVMSSVVQVQKTP